MSGIQDKLTKVWFDGWGVVKGGPGSGNFGHRGIPGQHGGSAPRGGSIPTEQGIANAEIIDDAFSEGLRRSDSWEDVDPAERGEIKESLVEDLSDITGIEENTVNDLVKQWAVSSNDNDMKSLSIQQDASKEFDVPMSEFTRGKIGDIKRAQEYKPDPDDPFLFEDPAEGTPPQWTTIANSDTQREYLRGVYDNTQAWFEMQGLSGNDTVRLFRGISLSADRTKGWKSGDTVGATGNALESWSIGRDIGSSFALKYRGGGKNGVLLSMDVPVKMILSTARSGFGCLTEGEIVVLGSLDSVAKVEGVWK